MATRNHTALLLLFLFLAAGNLAQAVSIKLWTESRFIGMAKEDAWKTLGKPSEPGEVDAWLITDSPDFMMLGMLGYEHGKVAMVSAVCQPKITYEKLREVQLTSAETTVVFDDQRGLLCKVKQPSPGGPNFIGLTRPDDSSTGPMVCEAVGNPFEGADAGKPETTSRVTFPGKMDLEELKSVSAQDCFDWQLLNDNGKIVLLNRIKKLWRDAGAENDQNAMDAKTLLDRITLPDQGIVFDSACKVMGIDPDPFRALSEK